MVAGRDDFIIAVRSAFLKKGAQQRFSLIALIFFSIALITLSKINFIGVNYLKISLNEVIYRVSFIISLPEKQIKKGTLIIDKHFKTYSDYTNTLEKIDKLEAEQYSNEFILSENKRLRKLIDEYIINSTELVAKVLLDKNSPFLKSIIVNKGSKDKVEIGMAVMDGEYLVGKIVEVNYSTSRALLISDLNSKIPVSINPGNYQSILSGTGKNFGKIIEVNYSTSRALLISDLNSKIPVSIEPGNIQSILSGTGKNNGIIEFMQKKKIIEKNSIVYSSGSGGIFKSGIPIGIMPMEEKNDERNVNFFSDLSQLTFVKLVSFNREEN